MIVTWSRRAAVFHVRRRKMFQPVFVVNGEIRAMKRAELAKTIHDPQAYAAAVDNFAQALATAERNAVGETAAAD